MGGSKRCQQGEMEEVRTGKKKKKMRPETFKRSFHVLYRQFNTLNSVAAYLYNVYIFLRLFMCVFSYLSMEIYQDK